MAKDTAHHQGSNMAKLRQQCAETVEKINNLKLKRQSVNEDIAAARADLEAKGIPKPALDMAMKYANWDEDKRDGFDVAYSIVREAIGMPINPQGELFDGSQNSPTAGEIDGPTTTKIEDDLTPAKVEEIAAEMDAGDDAESEKTRKK